MANRRLVVLAVTLLCLINRSYCYEVVQAINCGGRTFVDSLGTEYEEDPLREGYSSNHGERFAIHRVDPRDAHLYQTERYSKKSFSYTIPLQGEGKYLLVLKFAEVYFEAVGKKTFDVLLNDFHPVISELDIFREVGHATAHDEYIPFTVSRGKLFLKDGGVSEVRGGRLKITFVKGQADNPKINAIVLVKGVDANEFPRLPPLTRKAKPKAAIAPVDEEEEPSHQLAEEFDPFDKLEAATDSPSEDDQTEERPRRTSGPKQPDPYESDQSYLITAFIIVASTIIPVVLLKLRL